ncbi:MAG: hypothetical protein GZ085_04145 [Sulfuriferula multivorans]|uniref:Uncharacterized protein n=1 Tax=Sulfuriferula multivorans TaxID=1559896 RepID=A0A7C9JW27_9PROT|nr:hypothetical protein [Sulfuriferula multivorans]
MSKTPYERLGGAEGIARLVDDGVVVRVFWRWSGRPETDTGRAILYSIKSAIIHV